ncbi:predicted protein [Plenodomus lingam JN3]|uniref:Predicted protein n=1 Tax=Leptosphaeria maculans (strain JN3 / isolate v23.1.3 / race Av1-4-5-6-7-8) TaxID=985895 RepID=E4ZQ24_LEPMJ|nr:predicted protein [Plenodomus lingam JN3]CBX93559.1 predicted protein [Plenodomus lingam JN3]
MSTVCRQMLSFVFAAFCSNDGKAKINPGEIQGLGSRLRRRLRGKDRDDGR